MGQKKNNTTSQELVRWTDVESYDSDLTKTFRNGEKKPSANMKKGLAEVREGTHDDFLKSLRVNASNKAITLGRIREGILGSLYEILLKHEAKKKDDPLTIARSGEYFDWAAGHGYILLDYDHRSGQKYLPPDQLIALLSIFHPELAQSKYVIDYSTSSFLYNKDGIRVDTDPNYHILIYVKRQSDYPRYLKVLHERLILKGFGYAYITKSGNILIRSPIDDSVARPERLVFTAGLIIEDNGYRQERPMPERFEGGCLDTSTLADLSPDEIVELNEKKAVIRLNAQNDAQDVRDVYLKHKYPDENQRRLFCNAIESQLVGPGIGLELEDSRLIDSIDLLENGEEFDGVLLKDPVEPEWNSGEYRAQFYWNNGTNPLIHSFRFGKSIYTVRYDVASMVKIIRDAKAEDNNDAERIKCLSEAVDKLALTHCSSGELSMLANQLAEPKLITQKQVLRTVENKKKQLKPINPEGAISFDELNKHFGTLLIGGKFRIVQEKRGVNGNWEPIYIADSDFSKEYAHLKDASGEGIITKWLRSEKRNQFPDGESMVPYMLFRNGPRNLDVNARCYNSWQGFNILPAEGKCGWIKKLLQVLCNYDDELFEFVLDWLAHMIQKPEEKIPIVLVVRSEKQGLGKNLFFEVLLAKGIGTHADIVQDTEHVLGKFRDLSKYVLVIMDEALWAESGKSRALLKAITGSDTLHEERKYEQGRKVANYSRVVIMTNNERAAPAEIGDRRYIYMDAKDKQDAEFYKNVAYEIENGGREAFFWELKERPINHNFRQLPKNLNSELKVENQLHGAEPHIKFLYELLLAGDINFLHEIGVVPSSIYLDTDSDWEWCELEIPNSLITDAASHYRASADQFRKGLARTDIMREGRKGGAKRIRCKILPRLSVARAQFLELTGLPESIFSTGDGVAGER